MDAAKEENPKLKKEKKYTFKLTKEEYKGLS